MHANNVDSLIKSGFVRCRSYISMILGSEFYQWGKQISTIFLLNLKNNSKYILINFQHFLKTNQQIIQQKIYWYGYGTQTKLNI